MVDGWVMMMDHNGIADGWMVMSRSFGINPENELNKSKQPYAPGLLHEWRRVETTAHAKFNTDVQRVDSIAIAANPFPRS
jgi:hypothetical protein